MPIPPFVPDEKSIPAFVLGGPERKSFGAWLESLDVMKKYYDKGPVIAASEHDQIYSFLSTDDCPPESIDGKRLMELGWFEDEECWCMFA